MTSVVVITVVLAGAAAILAASAARVPAEARSDREKRRGDDR